MIPGPPIDNKSHFCALYRKTAADDGGVQITFLGSAFFFTHAGRVFAATAAHCVPSIEGEYQVVAQDTPYVADVAVVDRALDLCVFIPRSHPQTISMVLNQAREVPSNLPLYAYEFSATQVVNGQFRMSPATRVGNCVRLIDQEQFGAGGRRMLELSFPALKGASGCPVVLLVGTKMIACGVIVANAQRHLLPAQVETILDEKNDLLEERKYFLPQALAVNAEHLVDLIERELG